MVLRRDKSIRHFVSFHVPEVIGYEFDEVAGGEPSEDLELSVVTNKLVHDLRGDVVWMMGRRSLKKTYYLYGRLRIERQGRSEQDGVKYEIWGRGCLLKKPIVIDQKPWFQKFLLSNPNLSQGFQRITDKSVFSAMSQDFAIARSQQFKTNKSAL